MRWGYPQSPSEYLNLPLVGPQPPPHILSSFVLRSPWDHWEKSAKMPHPAIPAWSLPGLAARGGQFSGMPSLQSEELHWTLFSVVALPTQGAGNLHSADLKTSSSGYGLNLPETTIKEVECWGMCLCFTALPRTENRSELEVRLGPHRSFLSIPPGSSCWSVPFFRVLTLMFGKACKFSSCWLEASLFWLEISSPCHPWFRNGKRVEWWGGYPFSTATHF